MTDWPFGLLRKRAYGVIYCDFPWGYETYASASTGLRVPDC